MVILQIANLDLPTGWTVERTDWILSGDELFTDILAETRDDADNLFLKEYDLVLDPSKFYYAKCRVILNKGYTKYSKIVKFKPKDINEVSIRLDMPGIISSPSIVIGHNMNSVPVTKFKVNIDGFTTTGTGILEMVDYVIEDLHGKVLYSDLNNHEALTGKIFSDVVLPHKQIMRMRIAFRSSSGDLGVFATKTFKTVAANLGDVDIVTDLDNVVGGNDLTIESAPITGLIKIEWILYRIENGLRVIKLNTEETDLDLSIAGALLEDNSDYVLAGRATTTNGVNEWVDKEFRVLDMLPVNLPYKIKY